MTKGFLENLVADLDQTENSLFSVSNQIPL